MINRRHGLLVLGFLLAAIPQPAGAREPFDQFLAALRESHYYEEALAYLGSIQQNAQTSDELKRRVEFELGRVLLDNAGRQTDRAARDTYLGRAAGQFEKFGREHPQHVLAAAAQSQLASVLIERGRLALDGPSKAAAATQSRTLYEQAAGLLATAETRLDGQLSKMPKLIAPEDKELHEQKRQLASELMQVRLLRPSIEYEMSKTFEPGSQQASQHLTKGAKAYGQLYESYRKRGGGLLARLWEGRCYQELGNFNLALGCYQELIDLPATGETRALHTKGTRHALECWTHDAQKKYPEAIERGERWEKESGGGQMDADALAIRYLTALAYQAQSNALPEKDPNRKKLVGFARQYVNPVAQHPGEYQRPARMLLVALAAKDTKKDGKKEGKKGGKKGDAEKLSAFVERFEEAKRALEKLQDADAGLRNAPAGEKETRAKFESQKKVSAAVATKALREAIASADTKVPIDDVNLVRYYLCFLALDASQYYDAAVLGEFLARNYPESVPGRQGARIAMHALVRLYGESKDADKSFEEARISRLAELIFSRWPNAEESDEAAVTLLTFAAGRMDAEKALEYLNRIDAESPRRGPAELRAGQALWSAYLLASQAPDDKRPEPAKLDALKTQAREILTQGIARAEKAPQVDTALAAAAFVMAQMCVETGQPDKAIEWLEKPKIGALTLVEAKSPAVASGNFAVETYKIALRAYIATTPQQLEKAEKVMDALDKLVPGDADGKPGQNLTAIYISLGQQLEKQLQEMRKSGKKAEVEKMSKAFEIFLDRITKREAGGSSASLNWVAETYFSLGNGLDDGGNLQSPKAQAYFQKASTAYQQMLDIAEKEPQYKDKPDALIPMRLRLADCYRRGGKYDEALKQIVTVLEQKPQLLPAQVQGALTYQSRGATDSKGYERAIVGGSPGRDGKNVIWGWSKLSKLTMTDPKFAETFHQARLSMAEARYRYALTQEDPQKRSRALQAATEDLWYTYKLHKELGGEETRARYDRLLKQIQKGLGTPEQGVKEFIERDAQATAATRESASK